MGSTSRESAQSSAAQRWERPSTTAWAIESCSAVSPTTACVVRHGLCGNERFRVSVVGGLTESPGLSAPPKEQSIFPEGGCAPRWGSTVCTRVCQRRASGCQLRRKSCAAGPAGSNCASMTPRRSKDSSKRTPGGGWPSPSPHRIDVQVRSHRSEIPHPAGAHRLAHAAPSRGSPGLRCMCLTGAEYRPIFQKSKRPFGRFLLP